MQEIELSEWSCVWNCGFRFGKFDFLHDMSLEGVFPIRKVQNSVLFRLGNERRPGKLKILHGASMLRAGRREAGLDGGWEARWSQRNWLSCYVLREHLRGSWASVAAPVFDVAFLGESLANCLLTLQADGAHCARRWPAGAPSETCAGLAPCAWRVRAGARRRVWRVRGGEVRPVPGVELRERL